MTTKEIRYTEISYNEVEITDSAEDKQLLDKLVWTTAIWDYVFRVKQVGDKYEIVNDPEGDRYISAMEVLRDRLKHWIHCTPSLKVEIVA